MADSFRSILREGGPRALFKGYVPTVLSLSPFIAINFASFDTLKTKVLEIQMDSNPEAKCLSAPVTLSLGACAGLSAQTVCFPLDTVRRRMQLKGTHYSGTVDAFKTITRVEGVRGLYKGMLPNAIKIIPNNSIRFFVFDFLKRLSGSHQNKSEK